MNTQQNRLVQPSFRDKFRKLMSYRLWGVPTITLVPFALSVALALAFAIIVPHTDPDGARAWLEAKGYSDVKITGYNFFACSKGSLTHTGYVAVPPGGTGLVTGTVCWSPVWGNWMSWF